ncbi:MAG: tyrosine-protein phosphatase [Bacteroidales bacterium]|nr:tyrosine-protein phosphatase [Bacteroidales bacterium]
MHANVNASDGKEVARDTFYTKGHLHQIYFTKKVRNGRDLGGWTTYDGRTVRYRKLYRSGNFRDHVEAYFLSIGVTQQDINEFRSLMLISD